MNSKAAIMVILIMVILIVLVVTDQMRIRYLEEKLSHVMILDYDNDSLLVYQPEQLNEQKLFITPEFVDSFTRFKSPFSAEYESGYKFQDLINEYVHNRFQDHYGTKRGRKGQRRIHEGIDLFVAENTPVYPLSEYGVVTKVSDNPNHMEWVECWDEDGVRDTIQVEYGKIVRILYASGLTSTYVHLNEVRVNVGDEVHGDTVVGLTGVTGNLKRSGKESHLHLELRYLDGSSFDARWRLHWRGTDFEKFTRMLSM